MQPWYQNYYIRKFDAYLRFGIKSWGGRNFSGRICVFNRGRLNQRIYRLVDFFRRVNKWGYVFMTCYDANRTAFIRPIIYMNGLMSYIIGADLMKESGFIFSGELHYVQFPIGSATILKNIPLFSIISMVELKPYLGAKICRAAGAKCLLIGSKNNKCILKLSSKWQCFISSDSMAMFGQVSNVQNRFNVIGKAGKNRALGFRSSVRGLAKNPCDHPHGGGNGKKSHPPVPVSPWGRWTNGTPTTNTQFAVLRRRFFKNVI
jgi:large subunit ribosomal protein L2